MVEYPKKLEQKLEDNDWDMLLGLVAQEEAENQIITQEWNRKYREAIANLTEIYGGESRLLKYIRREYPHSRMKGYSKSAEFILSQHRKYIEKKLEDEKKTEEQKIVHEKEEQICRAIIYCQSKGKVLGVDFHPSYAINIANDLKYDELVSNTLAQMKSFGSYTSFNGNDYCEKCRGWDGESRRCECGNRRVNWAYDGDFEDMYIYAEAN